MGSVPSQSAAASAAIERRPSVTGHRSSSSVMQPIWERVSKQATLIDVDLGVLDGAHPSGKASRLASGNIQRIRWNSVRIRSRPSSPVTPYG